MLQTSHTGYFSLSPAILTQFALKMCAAKNREKTKIPYFGLQGYSRSSMLTPLRSSSPVLVMISCMYVPISAIDVKTFFKCFLE